MVIPAENAQRNYKGSISDSTRWQKFVPRVGDIVVNTPPKSGTTWTQGILAMLIAGDPDVDAQISMKSPWIDINIRPIDEVMDRLKDQSHRRQVKSHTPFDGLPFWEEVRYITVYRHPIDVHFSYRKHVRNQRLEAHGELFPEDPSESFRIFVDGDHVEGAGLASIVTHYRETLAREKCENLIRLHYADMVHNLEEAVSLMANHVGIHHPPEVVRAIVEGARFENMKANSHRFTPSAGQDFWREDSGFFDSASSNKWVGKLSDADLAEYETKMAGLMTKEERSWLEFGNTAI